MSLWRSGHCATVLSHSTPKVSGVMFVLHTHAHFIHTLPTFMVWGHEIPAAVEGWFKQGFDECL